MAIGIIDLLTSLPETVAKAAADIIDPSDHSDGDKVEVRMDDGSIRTGTVKDGKVELDDE